MSYKVLITEEIDQLGKDYIKQHGYEIKMGTGISEEAVIKDLKDCDAIITRNAPITENIIKSAKKLKVISMHGVGVDIIDLNTATKYGIPVTNAPESNKVAVAEYTIGLIVSLAKNFVTYDKGVKEGNWNIRKKLGMDLEGKTLGIIGMGNIGTLVAKKAAIGLGMKVIAYKRKIDSSAFVDSTIELTTDMEAVLKNSDFLSIHTPLTAETRKLLGPKELSLMKPGSFLINTARGEIVDTEFLAKLLSEKKIAGAAVDVFDGEVPSKDNPLFKLDNVILTPHAAAFTTETTAKMALHASIGVVEVLSNTKPRWCVNKEVLEKDSYNTKEVI